MWDVLHTLADIFSMLQNSIEKIAELTGAWDIFKSCMR